MIVDEGCWERGCACRDSRDKDPGVPVRRAEWQGMTDEEILEAVEESNSVGVIDMVRAIEAKLKEKNT